MIINNPRFQPGDIRDKIENGASTTDKMKKSVPCATNELPGLKFNLKKDKNKQK